MRTLADRLALLGAEKGRGWQAALARQCGVKQPSVADWLSGKSKTMEGANLLRAAEFFGVDPMWLATGKGARQQTVVASLGSGYEDPPMATIDQIYRDNLRLLAEQSGSAELLAQRIGKSATQLSQWMNGSKDSKTGKPRCLSRESAREIERNMAMPEGWMDQPHHAPFAPRGSLYEELTAAEQQMLDNFRVMLDDDQEAIAQDIANKAAKMRAYTDKLLREKFGAGAKPAKSSADARRTAVARAALEVTDTLRQRSLFSDPPQREPKP